MRVFLMSNNETKMNAVRPVVEKHIGNKYSIPGFSKDTIIRAVVTDIIRTKEFNVSDSQQPKDDSLTELDRILASSSIVRTLTPEDNIDQIVVENLHENWLPLLNSFRV